MKSKTLYHATTSKKAKQYRQTGFIKSPVRGFNDEKAAMAWAMKVGRTVIISFEDYDVHKLPDHHNKFGLAFWNDGNIEEWKCTFSAETDE